MKKPCRVSLRRKYSPRQWGIIAEGSKQAMIWLCARLPCMPVCKGSACNVGNLGSVLEQDPLEGERLSTPVFLALENSHCMVHGVTKRPGHDWASHHPPALWTHSGHQWGWLEQVRLLGQLASFTSSPLLKPSEFGVKVRSLAQSWGQRGEKGDRAVRESLGPSSEEHAVTRRKQTYIIFLQSAQCWYRPLGRPQS